MLHRYPAFGNNDRALGASSLAAFSDGFDSRTDLSISQVDENSPVDKSFHAGRSPDVLSITIRILGRRVYFDARIR